MGALAEGMLAGVGMPERLALAFSGSVWGRAFVDLNAPWDWCMEITRTQGPSQSEGELSTGAAWPQLQRRPHAVGSHPAAAV